MDIDSSAAGLREDLKFTQLVKEVSGGSPCPSSPSLSIDTPRRVDIRAIRGNIVLHVLILRLLHGPSFSCLESVALIYLSVCTSSVCY